jgi:hypothetical protein
MNAGGTRNREPGKLRLLIRWLGAFIAGLALIMGLYEGWQLVAGSRTELGKVGDVWYAIHPTSLQLLQPAIERHIEPRVGQWLWDPVVLTILTAPAWLVLGVIGAVLILIGWKSSR